MNREEYMKELEKNLRSIPKQEREEALAFYGEYLSDMEENNTESLENLDSPQQIGAQIKADTAMKTVKAGGGKKKSGISTAWTVLLAIFALPVGLPIVISVAVVALFLIIAAAFLMISLAAVAISVIISGIASLISAIVLIPTDFAVTIFYLGAGLLSLGVGYLMAIGVYRLSRATFIGIAKFINNIRIKMQNKQREKRKAE